MSDSEKEEQPVAKKRGRPSTGAAAAPAKKRPAETKSADEPASKKGRGRPKGSTKKKRGKPKSAAAAPPAAKSTGKSSGRGRPKKAAAKKDSTEDEEGSDNANSSDN